MFEILWFAFIFVLLANLLVTDWERMRAQRRRACAMYVLKTCRAMPVRRLQAIRIGDAVLRNALENFSLSGYAIHQKHRKSEGER